MPYVDTVGDVIRATSAVITPTQQVQEWGIHYQCSFSGGGDSRNGVASQWNTQFTSQLLAHLDPVANYWGSRISLVKSITPFQPFLSTVNVAGTSAGTTLPTQVRPLVSLKTAKAGPAYRGRVYIPTPTTLDLAVTGHPSAAYLTALAAYIGALVAPFSTGGSTWVPGIYHRTPTGPISSTIDPLTTTVVSNLWATQRRSGDYGRLNPPPW